MLTKYSYVAVIIETFLRRSKRVCVIWWKGITETASIVYFYLHQAQSNSSIRHVNNASRWLLTKHKSSNFSWFVSTLLNKIIRIKARGLSSTIKLFIPDAGKIPSPETFPHAWVKNEDEHSKGITQAYKFSVMPLSLNKLS